MRKRNVHIQFWLNRKEAESLDKKVRRSGLSREAYLRHLIDGVVPQDAPPPDYFSMMRELYGIANNLNQIAQKAHTLNVVDVQRYDNCARQVETAIKKSQRPLSCPGRWSDTAMATTSIWRVKGWLGKVVIYVENPDKTENPAFYEKQEMTERQAQGLSDVIDYAVNSEKTQTTGEATEVMQQFISGVNCHPSTAREEMIAVKKRFGKEDGTVAYHGYQSFAPGEATPEMAHEIGVKLAQQLWGDKYQVIVATHLDKDSHLHNHFVVNTVSFLDGLKYHRTEKDYYEMQKASDALCREYGLSVIENPQRGKSKQYGEWRAEQEDRPTWRGLIRAEIDEVIRQSMTERQFFDNLRKRGYEVKVGKDISVRPPGKERFVRLERNFGEDYSLEGIRRRILMQQRSERPLPEPEHKVRHVRLRGDFKTQRKSQAFGRCISLLLSAGHLPKRPAEKQQTPPLPSPGGFSKAGRHIGRNKAAGAEPH